jgi:hypothetical protein
LLNINGTGSITLIVALLATDILVIVGGRELSRTTDFVTAGDLLASSLNEQLDSNVIMSQQLDEKISRSMRIQPGDELSTLDLPLKDDRSDKLLGFDINGNVTSPSTTVSQLDAAVSSFVNATGNNASSLFYDPDVTGGVQATIAAKLGERISVKDFGAVGDGVTDDTVAIQAAFDYIRDAESMIDTTYAMHHRHLVFPPGQYKISDSIYVGFGYVTGVTNVPIHGTTVIDGSGALMIGSGSASTDHDCFVSAYWNGSSYIRTLGTSGESHLVYGIHFKNFAFDTFRRAFELQNYNHNCSVTECYGTNLQSMVYARRCFYTRFQQLTNRGTPEESGCYVTVTSASGTFSVGETINFGSSGTTMVVERWDSDNNRIYVKTISGFGLDAAESITGVTSGATATVSSYTQVANFDFATFVNIQPLMQIKSANHEIGIRATGCDGVFMQDCAFEGDRYGFLQSGESSMITIINAYIEGCTVAGMYFDDSGIARQMNLMGCFINQASNKLIGTDLNNSQYTHINFIHNHYESGDFGLPDNVIGNYYGEALAGFLFDSTAYSDTPKLVNMQPRILIDTTSSGYNGPVRIVDWNNTHSQNPGFYQSTFGQSGANVGPSNSDHPFQTLTTGTGSSSGSKYTFDTEIDAEYNLTLNWNLRYADTSNTKTRTFFIMSDNQGGTSNQTPTYTCYVKDGSTGDLSEVSSNFTAVASGGKVQLIADNLSGPALISSIVRVM